MERSKQILVTEEEQHQLLVDWNQTATDYPRDKTMAQLFEAQARHSADAVAVVYEEQALSYGQLNERANRLAHYLRARGVGPEVMVGICVERSLEMVVGLLGILKAGGAYVPLDPDYPKPRLAFMLEDAQVPVLLTLSSLQDGLPDFAGEVISLDTDLPDIEQASADNPAPSATADNLAYVIYTSGSTGQPKGVAVPQRAINRLVCNTDYFQVEPADRVAQASNVSFDAATFELWGALLNGAQLVGVSKDVLLNPQTLSTFLNEQGITALFITTALFNLMAREVPTAFSSLRGVMFGGEAVDPKSVRRVLTSGSPEHLLHVYGPTESTTFASWYRVEDVAEDATTVPIGKPIANTRLYILDREMNPVPVGAPGELYIGGDGLARGYLGRPELTAQRFVADPFSNEVDARLYRTGDRVQYRHDGAIEFLGRFDHQVKIRGFRIELGEIEATLRGHPEVQDAVVLAHETDRGDRRLAAYLVLERGVQLNTDELRSFLERSLPDYMIPSLFMVLQALPLTVNGKLDRKALPVPDWSHATGGSDYEPPRNSVEKLLAGVYAEVLGVENVGIHDNFFELGGHSLSATQLIARVRNIFHVELPFRSVYENPVLSTLADDIQKRISGESSAETFSIEPAKPGEQLPLSYSQERVWFIQHLDDFSRAYNTQATIHWHGELDITALEQSLTEIVRRHEIFRTTFVEENGTPVQCIHQASPVKLRIVNLESSDPSGREDQIKALIKEAFQDPFDVAQLPLIRWTLIKLGAKEHLMTHVEHHMIHDGWSLNVFLGELLKLYKAYHTGKPSPLAELAIQFSDFARWQRRWMQGEEARKQLAYWKQQLAGCQPLLELPYDRPRPAVQRFRGAAPRFELPAELCEGIERICREAGVSPFITFLTGLIILLYRYSSQQDICVGTSMANRRWHEMESLIGMIINNVVLRTDLSDNPSVNSLLSRVRDCTLDASANQDMPFEKVVEVLKPERSLSYNPLFQVMLGIHDSPMPQLELPALSGEVDVGLATDGAKFDLTVVVVPGSALQVGSVGKSGPESWTVIWEYNTDLFDEETANRMTSHYQSILKSMISAPEKQIETLSFLSASEQHQLLEWNQTTSNYPSDKTLSGLFQRQAQHNPQAIAVEFADQALSYGELEARSNQLARYLQAHGVGPEVLVGICVERSLEMVVALLGILKAGGAYVPLDPDYPQSRLAFMLDDAQAPVLLSMSSLQDQLPAFDGELICLDMHWPAIEQECAENPSPTTTADNLAYVIYTSGSTGEPKGVAVPHRAICNHMLWMQDTFPLTETDKVLQKTPFSFDASIWEFFAPLMAGAQLVMARPEAHKDAHYLANVIAEQQITRLQVVPSLLQALLDEGLIEGCHSLRQVFCGGETLLPELQKRFFACHHAELYNLYGPTEATIDATFWQCDRHSQARSVPIGRPISNTTVYILDSQMNPVPVGVPGELYIGGDGLARGYLKRPELTAEKFVADPFSDEAGARLYRTGDRVRYRRDGAIEFLGRFDHQVKLRGFRIELGEIESLLCQHNALTEAVVLCRDDEAQGQRLVAYVIAGGPEVPSVVDLRTYVRQTLPDYMVPSAFMVLDSFPLTANGKVDRDALPSPDMSAVESEQDYVAPRNELETQLADIWAEVLNVDRVSVHDNFFDLGGHSLIATQVVSRVRKVTGIELSLTELLTHTTISELARVIGAPAKAGRADETANGMIQPAGREDEIPLSFAQERLWFLCQLAPESPAYNMLKVMRLRGRLNIEAVNQSLQEIVNRHESLRTTFTMQQGRAVQKVAPDVTIKLPVHDLVGLSDVARAEENNRWLRHEALQPFDLVAGPVIRARLLKVGEEENLLLLAMHHIASDGWSMGVLFQELSALYSAFCACQPSPLPALEVQYADFASWQRNWLSGNVLDAQLNYWRDHLEGHKALDIPSDRPRPKIQSFRGGCEIKLLAPGLLEDLRALSEQEGATLFMTLLAAFSIMLNRYSGQEDILVGSPIANRNRAEIEGLIGFFVNSLVMRVDVSGEPTFHELLGRVKKMTLSVYQHQDLPFEKLVDELNPERDLGRNPLFQIMFALQNAPSSGFLAEGLSIEIVRPDVNMSRFELEVHLFEKPEGLEIVTAYSTDLFDEETIANMLGHYEALLESVVANPQRGVSEFVLLTEKEQRQLLVEWNQTVTDYPREKTVHEIFELQAAATPDATAVIYQDYTLSYQQLNERANRLAHYLLNFGVGPEVMVGLYMERSLDMVVGLLGILKAGGAYVPLDPDYPQQRLEFILEDIGTPILLTQSSLQTRLQGYLGHMLYLDSKDEQLETQSKEDPHVQMQNDNLAYVIYTSGSTGEPKGVEVTHGGLLNLVSWHCRAYQVSPADRATHLAGLGFDASVWELWPYLAAGASLYLVPDEQRHSPASLWDWMAARGITLSFLPTPLAEAALREPFPEGLALRALLTGGDRLHRNLTEQPLPFRLVNHYGPTENTVVTTCAEVDVQSEEEPTIGWPIDNVRTYILDAHRQPVPAGVTGELYIGGDGLARGYLNQPELTAEQFVSDPFSDVKGALLYRTGDTVRYRRDGAIEFIGRVDHQVKIRGFRIELGEIETVLSHHEAVQDTVVMVREDDPGDKRLVAYTVPTKAWVEQISNAQSGEHVEEWQALYEETYGNTPLEQDPTFNITGWNSSYSGEPIPVVEMREWVEATVARIEALAPQRVLEIGCGTGLLLYRLAPACARYVGTDFSAVAQAQVQELVSGRESHRHVVLWQRLANDFSGVQAGDFDTVVINSVTQYLPSIDYLAEVLAGAVAAVAAGGRVFVGDVRSYPLLKSYHASVESYSSPDSASSGELLRSVQQHVEEENELVIEPAFFQALKRRIPRLSHVEVLLKQGAYHNELSCYRYDVVLHVEAAGEALPATGRWLEWGAEHLSETHLRQVLVTEDQDWLGVRGMPNARVAGDVAMLERLEMGGAAETVGGLRASVEATVQQALEPAVLWQLAGELDYALELSYTGSGTDGRMDALFRRSGREECAGRVYWPQEDAVPERPWSAYGTNPLKGKLGRELIPQLRDELEARLPEYMVPSVFVMLDALPLNPNGKVERRALPVPGDVRGSLGTEYTAPRSELEDQLVQIWSELLKLEQVGVHDNFFEFGGHSLLATQVVSRLREALGVDLPLSEVFGYPTIAALAEIIDAMQWARQGHDEEHVDPQGNRQTGEL